MFVAGNKKTTNDMIAEDHHKISNLKYAEYFINNNLNVNIL
jgi:hypothetical protein